MNSNEAATPQALLRGIFMAGAFAFAAALSTTAAGQEEGDEDSSLDTVVLPEDEAPEVDPPRPAAQRVDEIVVTGSRLTTNQNIVSPNPVLSIGEDEIDSRGITRIEDLTNQLPQAFAAQASEVSNGASGTAQLDLRGLGAIRTLPLINGRRLPFGSSQSSPANIDLVPTRLIERVEIVTGGASAVYGSDAVAGVANFILKDDFEGLELDFQGGFNQAGNSSGLFEGVLRAGNQPVPGSVIDGEELNLSATMGMNGFDGRGNATLFVNYEDLSEITQDDRVVSGCALGAADGPNSFRGIGCVGSANFRLFGGPGGFAFQEEQGEIVEFVGGPAQTFNFGPFNFFQRPRERFQIFGRSHYEFSDELEAFADLGFMNTTSDAQVAPTASFGIGAYSINCDNPFIQDNEGIPLRDIFGCNEPDPETGETPTDVSGISASHRNVEGGPRVSSLDLSTFRMIGGLRGTFLTDYDFEVFGQYSRSRDEAISVNDFVIDNVQEAFFVVEDEDGNPVCRSGNPNCVPYNIFQRGPNGESLVTQEALNFIQGIGITTGETKQFITGGHVQTDLGRLGVQSPYAETGAGLLIGGEFRRDELVSEPDQISQQPDGGFTGVGGPTLPVTGELRVSELFFETQMPLITGARFADRLSVGGAYRYSDYTTDGAGIENSFDTNTFHAFVDWAPNPSVRLRTQFQRAVRAPNVIELFTPQGTNLPNLTAGPNGAFDPCATDEPAATLEECMRTGVTEEQYGEIIDVISGQTQSITGGNPNLDPEESDTITIGAIITPEAVPGLSFSIDYFSIEVDDAISAGIPAQATLDNCLATGDPAFCDLIQRDAQGSLNAGSPGVGFTQTNLNIASLETSGIDLQANYKLPLRTMGSLRFDYAATYLDKLDETPFPGGNPVECAGEHAGSCRVPSPKYRHRMRTSWQTPWIVDVDATWRFFSSTDNNAGKDVNPAIDRKIDTVQYLDLSVRYPLTDRVRFRAGVNNVGGKKPPVVTSAGPPEGNGNTYPAVFDTGRFFFFGTTIDL